MYSSPLWAPSFFIQLESPCFTTSAILSSIPMTSFIHCLSVNLPRKSQPMINSTSPSLLDRDEEEFFLWLFIIKVIISFIVSKLNSAWLFYYLSLRCIQSHFPVWTIQFPLFSWNSNFISISLSTYNFVFCFKTKIKTSEKNSQT